MAKKTGVVLTLEAKAEQGQHLMVIAEGSYVTVKRVKGNSVSEAMRLHEDDWRVLVRHIGMTVTPQNIVMDSKDSLAERLRRANLGIGPSFGELTAGTVRENGE